MLADFKYGKREEYLGAPYWGYNNEDMPHREALSNQPSEDDIESFDWSV